MDRQISKKEKRKIKTLRMHNFRPCALAVNVELTARHRNDKDEKKKKKSLTTDSSETTK